MTELDRAIVRIAMSDAWRHLIDGRSPEEAAALATPGPWAEYRLRVLLGVRAAGMQRAPASDEMPADARGQQRGGGSRAAAPRAGRDMRKYATAVHASIYGRGFHTDAASPMRRSVLH